MENEVILLDTSILIEYYRKKDKSKSTLFRLANTYSKFAVSAITHFEIYTGANHEQLIFWNDFFRGIVILPFDSEISIQAADINKELKKISKQIDTPDLFIAATAMKHNLSCATLNKKHFERIKSLQVLV
ncbi:MAG: type II toxin-antitoxin system VapC family toxin [Mucilaginibacter sp.]